MSELGEAVGTAVEGGLVARAVEREGVGAPLRQGHFAEAACLNCGSGLTGPYCHHCGQKAHLHRTLGAFMHDLVHGALHVDGKVWHTLPKLALRPGELTRRYIDGERARFVSPMALFLFAIFLMFAVFQLLGISAPTQIDGPADSARAQAEAVLGELRSELEQNPEVEPAERAEIEGRIGELEQAIEDIDTGRDYRFSGRDGRTVEARTNLTGIRAIDEGLIAKWRQNPGLMLYKLQTNFYKFSWLLIPLSVPFVWLLFAWKRRFRAYDHAIFVTYSLCFMTLLILVTTLGGAVGLATPLLVFSLLLIPPFHLYRQLRGAYGLSRFSALWRLAVLTIFIVIVLTLFLQLLLVLGAF